MKSQESSIIEFEKTRIKNILISVFRGWKVSKIVEGMAITVKSNQIVKYFKLKKEYFIFISWYKQTRKRVEFSLNFYEKRILQITLRNWKLSNILRKLKMKLGPVCGVKKLNFRRSFQSWIEVWKKKNKFSYAFHILQCTYDRVRTRRALFRWPGWREWRKSEEFMKLILLKKRGRGRLLSVIGLREREMDEIKEKEMEKEKSNLSSSFELIRQRKNYLSLADRIAIECTYVICENYYDNNGVKLKFNPNDRKLNGSGNGYGNESNISLPESYNASYAMAKTLLLNRTGISTNTNTDTQNRNRNNDNKSINHRNQNAASVRASDAVRSELNSKNQIDFLFKFLKTPSTRAEQAVKEIFLLLHLVLAGWLKAVKTLKILRIKERKLFYSHQKVL